MLRKFQIVGIAGALIFSAVILTDTLPSNPPPLPEPIVQNVSTDSVEVVATNFEKPWSITFADERIFVSEKSGKIKPEDRIVKIRQDDSEQFIDVVGWRIDEVVDLIREFYYKNKLRVPLVFLS